MHPWVWPGSPHHCPSGCLGMQVQHQTSTHAGNILSYLVMETHANLTPVQVYATCMCLPKRKAKKHGHCQKSCQGFGQLFGKGRLFGRPLFQTNPQELSTLCIYPKQLLKHTKNVSINKTLSITTHAQYVLSCNLGGTSHEQSWPQSCSVLEIMQWKEMHQLLHRTWGGMILKGIFLNNFWDYML